MDWQELLTEINRLSAKITNKPNIIVGITRGGVVPARLLSARLNVKDMHCISVRKDADSRYVVTEIKEDIIGKNVLLVEDMLETGYSLEAAKRYLEEKGAKVETACLYTMPTSKIEPGYCLREVNSVVAFPWE